MEHIIEISGLSYNYPDGKSALHDISLKVAPGEKIALIGANGAGKSTLLLHLNGILEGSGRVLINGMEVNKHNMGQIRASVGLVFQNPDDQIIFPTVVEELALGLQEIPLASHGQHSVPTDVDAFLSAVYRFQE